MEIRDLRVFVAVVEEGSLTAAARRLHMSQPSVTQIVQSLERQLSGRLLTRDHTGTRTTETGAVLFTEGRSLLERHDRLVAKITAMPTATTLPLRVGVPLELPPDLLPTAITQLRRLMPDLDVQMHHCRSSTQLSALKSAEIPDTLVWHPLIGDPIVRRTWVAWLADSRRRDLAALIAVMDLNA